MTQQRGISLIELLISMVLSLTVIAGVGSLFFQMQKSNKIQRALASMADESSYVQEILQKEIRRTGGLRSRSDRNGTDAKIFLSHTNLLGSAAILGTGINLGGAEYIKGDATATSNDAFVIRYQLLDATDLSPTASGSNGSSPCTQDVLLASGEDPADKEHVVNVFFYLSNGILKCTAQRHVQDIKNTTPESCAANCTTPNSTSDFSPVKTPIELTNNIVRFAIRYGVDSTHDGAADYYTDAATVPSANWIDVISIRLTFAISSADDYLRNDISNYVVEGVSYTPTDHRIYKVFTTTIALRNQI